MKLRQSGHFGDVSHIGFPRTDGPHLLSAFSCPRYTIQISYLGMSVRHTLDPVSRLFPISAHVDINDGPNTLLILTTGKGHLIRNVSVRENPSARTSLRGISPSGDAWFIPFSPSTVPHLAFDFAVERLVHSFGNTVVNISPSTITLLSTYCHLLGIDLVWGLSSRIRSFVFYLELDFSWFKS